MSRALRLGLLYTGGTIGMVERGGTLVPGDGDALRPLLHGTSASAPFDWHWRWQALAPAIDSADATPAFWHRMAQAVAAQHAGGLDGVLVLHGTDTLAHSAAALAFLLHGLPMPVVLTGSMRPASAADSDAPANLRGAAQALRERIDRPAAPAGPTGVWLHFAGRTLRGARATKWRSDADDAFADPARAAPAPAPPAAPAPAPWDWRHPWRPRAVGLLWLHPGAPAALLHALIDNGHAGCVLACYGSGTAPATDADWRHALARARGVGMAVVAISQCPQGRVALARYEAGARLAALGVIDGGALGPEAALAKLHTLLAAGLDAAACAREMPIPRCGEG